MKLTPCCTPFGILLSNAGEKGCSAVPRIRDEMRQFFLQARPFERDAVSKLSAVDPATGENKWPSLEAITGQITPLVTVLVLPLKFCPSCGQDLRVVIDRNPEAFEEAARDAMPLWET